MHEKFSLDQDSSYCIAYDVYLAIAKRDISVHLNKRLTTKKEEKEEKEGEMRSLEAIQAKRLAFAANWFCLLNEKPLPEENIPDQQKIYDLICYMIKDKNGRFTQKFVNLLKKRLEYPTEEKGWCLIL